MNNKNICMIAHRGYSSAYPDNTEIAFIKAAENHSGGAETDVRVTKDGILVVNHNDEVVFADGSELLVAEATYAELSEKPIRNTKSEDTVYICTFRRYLEIMKENNMICFVELKGEFSDDKVREVFDTVSEIYDLSKCIMQSFEFANLIKAREMFPNLPLMLTYGSDEIDYRRCFDYGFSLDAYYKAVTEEMIKEFHDRNLEVALWTVNDKEALDYCLSLDIDYIESDVFGGFSA